MLERRGWVLAGGGVGLAGAGRVFGIVELFVLAVVALALVAIAVITVRLRQPRLQAVRALRPPRLHAGGASRVDLELRNRGRRTPLARAVDAFDGGRRRARFLVAPLAPGERRKAAYRLPTDQRGIFDVGPLVLTITDPLGLAGASYEVAPVTQLTVYPRIDAIRPIPDTSGHDPHSGQTHSTVLTGPGEDFYAIRPYERGDDTRRVHWPSMAKLDELMIRQDEMPWQNRATVLLDVRRSVHDSSSLEAAVSAAASVHDVCRRQGALIRVVTTAGKDSGFAAGHAHAQAVLEHLAAVGMTREDRFAGALSAVRRSGSGGALVVITTNHAPPADIDSVAALARRYALVVLVRFDRAGMPHETAVPAGVRLAAVSPDVPFPRAWERALSLESVRR